MVFQPADVVRYLIQQGLLTPEQVVADELIVTGASRRHAAYGVYSAAGSSYFVKQGIGSARSASLAAEAAIYEQLTTDRGAHPIRRYMPRLSRYDPVGHVLVLELLVGAESLSRYQQRRGRFGTGLAVQLGQALARLHRLPTAHLPLPSRPPPLVLSLPRPALALYPELSQANLRLITILQQFAEFGQRFEALAANWQPSTLIHNDLKGENMLVIPGRRGTRPAIKLVDWEAAGLGDPCWDVGAVFADYLNTWLQSVPLTGADPPERLLELARYPLIRLQPAIRRFWESYVAYLHLDRPTAMAWLARAVAYSAARLVQTAVEQAQLTGQLMSNALLTVQVSFNILLRPHEAAAYLLGLA